LRFGHAETVIPLVAELGLDTMSTSLPFSQPYSYENSQWRGDLISPMAANIQWDTYRNDKGDLLVKMLHNEKETDFKPACNKAKISPDSHFYDYEKLKACYGHESAR
jgi:hypothetical protein